MFSVSKLFVYYCFVYIFVVKFQKGLFMQIGKKIKDLRIQKNLTQEELADRCELSKGFISQLERDLTSPSIATLIDILQCLGTDLKESFDDSEDEQIAFKETDYFEKIDEELKKITISGWKKILCERGVI